MYCDMRIADFFTELDDSVAGETHIDPLGTLVIWSAYGQAIFRGRVNSISNDARSYTLNLFHHNFIRNLIANNSVKLSPALERQYSTKDSLAFKQACLLYLEKLFVFSVTENEAKQWVEHVDLTGVLGILKARRVAAQGTVAIRFGPDQVLLTRQLLLGVSGRYKTPMVEMGFFDKAYRYDLEVSQDLWSSADSFIAKDDRMRELRDELTQHFRVLLADGARIPTIDYDAKYARLMKAYTRAFPSSADVGKRSRRFWLAATGLNQGVPGAVLRIADALRKTDIEAISAQELFAQAKQGVIDEEGQVGLKQIAQIEAIEPFLADIELLFSLMLSKGVQNIDDVKKNWSRYARRAMTIPSRARKIAGDPTLREVLSETGRKRLDTLVQLGDAVTLDAQIHLLFDYHTKVMDSRGQGPWLAIDANENIKVFTGRAPAPDEADCPEGYWTHHYYIPQFINLIRGFQGVRS
jgi:hypothetical protein